MVVLRNVRWQPSPERTIGEADAASAHQKLAMSHPGARHYRHQGGAQRPLPLPPRPAAIPSARANGAAADAPAEGLNSDLSDTLSLSNIRQSLILMEDTIIFGLIERAQFARNAAVYRPGAVPVPGYTRDGRQLSLLEYLLRETEQLHGRIRRYTNPDETAFFPDDLPLLVLPPLSYPQVLAPCAAAVNVNAKIMDMYLSHLLPDIATPGDDRNYGSSALYDVMILQALSRRIHYGKFVAEAKFRSAREEYGRLIAARDAAAILELLTDQAVERKVVERVKLKAATFGQDLSTAEAARHDGGAGGPEGRARAGMHKIRPEAVSRLYEQWVMPLTKEVEVDYLLRRLDD